MRPQRRQPTRLPCPWDSPGKSTGVGYHFLLQCMKVKSESEVAQWGPTLHDPMDYSLPGSSVHGIFQAIVLEWGANSLIFLKQSIFLKGNTPCLCFCCLVQLEYSWLFYSNRFPINTHVWFQNQLRVTVLWDLPWFTQVQIITLSFLLSLYAVSYTIIIFVSIYICLLYYTICS